MCRFHSQHPPTADIFDKLEADTVGMTLVYNHISGAFVLEFHRDGSSTLRLYGEFKHTSFIPIKLNIIPQ